MKDEIREVRMVFLSLPFKNRTKEDILNTIVKMENKAKEIFDPDDRYDIMCVHNYYSEPINEDCVNPKMSLIYQAIGKMMNCDYFMGYKDIFQYTGCEIEKRIAEKYMDSDNIYLLPDWEFIPDCLARMG